jgi:hypothetical protein
MVEHSRSTAQAVSTVAAAMQSTSQALCREVPDIVRKAVKADLREFPRHNMNFNAGLEVNDRVIAVTVQDVSRGGVRIDGVKRLGVGDRIALTFPGMTAIAGEIVRGGVQFGVSFAPALLSAEELRDLVTLPRPAA